MDIKKKCMLIGSTSAGKTTLCQYINEESLRYYKTQTVQVINGTMIDTPGEYIERSRLYYGALMVTSSDADVILLVQDATNGETRFPGGYAASFGKPVIGIVTKSDIASPEQIEIAKQFLMMAGVEKIFVTSSVKGTGFKELLDYLS